MYNIYCDNINTLGYKQKQNAYIVLLIFNFLKSHGIVFVKNSKFLSICLKPG